MKQIPRFFLIALIFSFAAVAIGAEVARLKVQEGLSRFLGVPVHVQRLTLSANRITLHGVSLQSPASVPLRIERLRLEGSLWSKDIRSITLTGLTLSVGGVPLQAEGRVSLRGKPGSYAQAEGLLTLDHPLLRGEVEVSGPLLAPVVFGWLETAQSGRRNFLAKLDIHRELVRLQQMQIQGGWSAAGSLVFRRPSWRADLIVTSPNDQFKLRVEPAVAGSTRAVLWAQRDGMVPREFTAQWVVRKGRLELQVGLLGDQAVLAGQVELQFPYRTDVTLNVDDLNLAEIEDWIPSEGGSSFSGKMTGRMEVSGALGRVLSAGELIASQGKFGRMDFDQIAIRFEGHGPVLRIGDSQIKRRGGTMLMEGTVDLRRVGRPDFFRLVKLTPANDSGGVKLGNLAIGPTSGEGVKMQTALSPHQNLNLRLDREEQVIAVEHRKKF